MFRWTNATYPINRLQGQMDRLFDTVAVPAANLWPQDWFERRTAPALNVWEDEQNLYAEAELPGLAMEDIDVVTTADELRIKGEHKADESKDVTVHRRERRVGAFSRVLRFPIEIDPEKVQATLKDGVLTVTLPKAETARVRKIEVKAIEN